MQHHDGLHAPVPPLGLRDRRADRGRGAHRTRTRVRESCRGFHQADFEIVGALFELIGSPILTQYSEIQEHDGKYQATIQAIAAAFRRARRPLQVAFGVLAFYTCVLILDWGNPPEGTRYQDFADLCEARDASLAGLTIKKSTLCRKSSRSWGSTRLFSSVGYQHDPRRRVGEL